MSSSDVSSFEGSNLKLKGRGKEGIFTYVYNFDGSIQKLKGGDKEGVFLLGF